MSERILEQPEEVNFFDPPTTHLVANVEYLMHILEGETEEAKDQEKTYQLS